MVGGCMEEALNNHLSAIYGSVVTSGTPERGSTTSCQSMQDIPKNIISLVYPCAQRDRKCDQLCFFYTRKLISIEFSRTN